MPDTVVNLLGEVWKPVVGYEGSCVVSNMGRVRSCAGVVRKPYYRNPGYAIVNLSRPKSIKTWYVHRLVLEAFVGPCPDGMECCHNDGDPTNNRLENLRWDTRCANQADRVRHGTRLCGERHPMAKLSKAKADDIRRLLASGWQQREVARLYGIGQATVGRINRREAWA
jgi:hypothetical protein